MTIEERVEKLLMKEMPLYIPAEWVGFLREKCIKIATDQRKIDIEKACEALYTIQDLLNADLMDIEQAKEIMRKTMEE